MNPDYKLLLLSVNNLFLIAFIFIISSFNAFATPAKDIALQYDAKKEQLHVEAIHVSNSLQNHYIHRMSVTKNADEPVVTYFSRQSEPSKFIADTALEAQPGDSIRVELLCIKGGVSEATLVVPKPEEKKEMQK